MCECEGGVDGGVVGKEVPKVDVRDMSRGSCIDEAHECGSVEEAEDDDRSSGSWC